MPNTDKELEITTCGVANPGGTPCTKTRGHEKGHDPAAYGPSTDIPILDDDAVTQRRKSPPLSPCDTCGKMVTTGGAGRKQHMKIHNRATTPGERDRARFERLFDVIANGCWIWRKTSKNSPYGCFYFAGRNYMAFIFSWWLYRGELVKYPPLVLDHLCKNKPCVNPDHLEPVTQGENVRRATDRPACPKGHPFTPENIVYTKRGYRVCLPCRREHGRKFYADHKDEINRKDREKYARKQEARRASIGR